MARAWRKDPFSLPEKLSWSVGHLRNLLGSPDRWRERPAPKPQERDSSTGREGVPSRGEGGGGVLMGTGAWESEVAPFARDRIRSGEVHARSRDATPWPDDKRVLKGKGMAHRKMAQTPLLRSPVGVKGVVL